MGKAEIWQAPILPVVDFNADGIVDSTDMRTLIEHWEQAEPSCDIAPAPFGDGIVDVRDLVVLAEHLFEPLNDPTLEAHWALDEAGGDVAHESVSDSDDVVMGGPLWQPTGGKVAGALELDGIDDYVTSSFSHNPAQGPFSILAWIKGGGPAQVIISQRTGINYLMTDQDGKLMTELGAIGRVPPLWSPAFITDEQWHRIALVWDGSKRTLCLDGVVVAEDTPSGMGASAGGIEIGVGSDFATGTFWSGLIDDVRVYNRAVSP